MMHKKEPFFLLAGDVFFLFLSLWIALSLRYGELATLSIYREHLIPFSLLFVVWIIVFFIAGLYGKHTLILKSRLPSIIFNAQIANTVIAVLFFYFIPFLVITPKTILFIYLVTFFLLTLGWRIYGYRLFAKKHKQRALLVGSGREMDELYTEVNNNTRYDLVFVARLDARDMPADLLEKEIANHLAQNDISIVAIDLDHEKVSPILPTLYSFLLSNVRFVGMHRLYEEIFDRIPLSIIKHSWFLQNISTTPKIVYDMVKRTMDIVVSLVFGIPSLVVYPFVALAIKLDDGGALFSSQTRVGQNNKPIKIFKFRTMTVANDKGEWGKQQNKVTRVGYFLRKSRIDELPQIWNVLVGDISLIGPRPEFPVPVQMYSEQIPYYSVRHILKPGLSGWAQIYHERHPHHGLDAEETKNKLSYDLYYIKNRSVLLDVKIALQTLKILIMFAGR